MMKLFKQQGQGMVGLLVSSSLLILMIGAIFQVLDNTYKAQKSVNVSSVFSNYVIELTQITSDKASCKTAFLGQAVNPVGTVCTGATSPLSITWEGARNYLLTGATKNGLTATQLCINRVDPTWTLGTPACTTACGICPGCTVHDTLFPGRPNQPPCYAAGTGTGTVLSGSCVSGAFDVNFCPGETPLIPTGDLSLISCPTPVTNLIPVVMTVELTKADSVGGRQSFSEKFYFNVQTDASNPPLITDCIDPYTATPPPSPAPSGCVLPTNPVLTQASNSKQFTVSWTAGTCNGGLYGCRFEYLNPIQPSPPAPSALWSPIKFKDGFTTANCDATVVTQMIELPGEGWVGSPPVSPLWNNIPVRVVRNSDNAVMATFAQNLTCTTLTPPAAHTTLIDEYCNGQWGADSATGVGTAYPYQ